MKSRPKNLWIFENVQSPRAILVFLLNLDYVKIKQLPYMIISVKKPVKKPVQCMQTTHRSLETVRTERRWNDTYEKAQHFLNVATILWLGHKNWCWMLSMHWKQLKTLAKIMSFPWWKIPNINNLLLGRYWK